MMTNQMTTKQMMTRSRVKQVKRTVSFKLESSNTSTVYRYLTILGGNHPNSTSTSNSNILTIMYQCITTGCWCATILANNTSYWRVTLLVDSTKYWYHTLLTNKSNYWHIILTATTKDIHKVTQYYTHNTNENTSTYNSNILYYCNIHEYGSHCYCETNYPYTRSTRTRLTRDDRINHKRLQDTKKYHPQLKRLVTAQ